MLPTKNPEISRSTSKISRWHYKIHLIPLIFPSIKLPGCWNNTKNKSVNCVLLIKPKRMSGRLGQWNISRNFAISSLNFRNDVSREARKLEEQCFRKCGQKLSVWLTLRVSYTWFHLNLRNCNGRHRDYKLPWPTW